MNKEEFFNKMQEKSKFINIDFSVEQLEKFYMSLK